MKNLFPVFRAGKYPQGKYDPEDVKELFEKYDPDFLSAPFTIDHKEDGPAYGYAETLEFDDDTLFASKDDLSDNLKSAIKDKHFRRVSIEIYKDLPEKGRYIKAISFLGVKAPQVKGLEGDIKQTKFKDAESETIEFDVDWDEEGEEFELKEAAAGKSETTEDEAGDETESGDDTETESFEALQSKINKLEKEKEDLTDKFETSEQEREQAQNRLEEISLSKRRLKFEQFLNERVAYGNLLPKNKEKVMDLLIALDSVEKFEHEEATTDDTPVKVFKEYLESRPKIIDDEEEVTKESDSDDFESYSHELAAKAREYKEEQAEKGKVISFAEAVTAVENNKQ